MNNKLNKAFEEIKAEDSLKESTKTYINQVRSKQHFSVFSKKQLSLGLALIIMFIFFASMRIYYTPVAAISIDSESSVEFAVNRFNRVVDYQWFDAAEEEASPSFKHQSYMNAVSDALESNLLDSTNAENSIIEITVANQNNDDTERMMDKIQGHAHHHNIIMYQTNLDSQEEAHHHGMSIGKHRMFELLKESDPDINIDSIRGHSMHELHQMQREQGHGRQQHHRMNRGN